MTTKAPYFYNKYNDSWSSFYPNSFFSLFYQAIPIAFDARFGLLESGSFGDGLNIPNRKMTPASFASLIAGAPLLWFAGILDEIRISQTVRIISTVLSSEFTAD